MGFWQNFPAKKNDESENLAKVTSSRNEKQIYLQIGIMGWNDGMCMKKRIIEPNFIPSLREISTSFFPFSCPPPIFSFHIVKGPLPPLLTPLLLLSNASKAIKDLFLYMETTSLQNNMNLMRKWGTMAIPMYFELKFGQTNNLGCFSFVCSFGGGVSFLLSLFHGREGSGERPISHNIFHLKRKRVFSPPPSTPKNTLPWTSLFINLFYWGEWPMHETLHG